MATTRRFARRSAALLTLVAGVAAAAVAAQIVAAVPAMQGATASAPWHDITPDRHLVGWRPTGGGARYEVVGNELVGRAMPGKTNSWLVSNARFGDYIMEFDAKTDPLLNSGVMVRGQSRPDYRNGVVHGYQAEIDPFPRGWSGGMYDEQRRQWLYSLADNQPARAAYKPADWNHYRVEAIGNRIRTWINGVPATDTVDATDASGFIAFQVHAIPDADAAKHPEVRFRNVRVITDRPARYAMPENGLKQAGWLTNALSSGEKRAGWKLLWDGRTGAGWRALKGGGFPANGWSTANGTLSITSGGGDIVTTQPYRDFELSVDFRISEGANSGIKYRIGPDQSGVGLEYQVLDDQRHPDAKLGHDGDRTLGSLYDLIPARNLSDPSSPGKRVNPPGEWNRAVIVVKGNHVEHWLNGFKLVEYERGSPSFEAAVARSKFAGKPGFGAWPQSSILLQDHGDHVDYRSIKLRTF